MNKNILSFSKTQLGRNDPIASDGYIFKVIKVVYWLVAAYAAFMSAAIMMGSLVLMDEFSAMDTPSKVSAYNEQKVYFIMMLVSVLFIVSTYFLIKHRLAILLAVFGSVSCVINFTVFYSASVTNDIKNGGMSGFWLKLGVPSILCALIAITLSVFMIIEKVKIKKIYNKMVTKLYDSFTSQNGDTKDSEAFEKFLDDYDGREIFRTDIPLKRSVRKRKDKQNI